MVKKDDSDELALPHPRETTAFYGHREAETALLDAYRSRRIPHAWLIGGPLGIGKATLAYRMARFVFAHADPSAPDVQSATSLDIAAGHPVARRVASQAHPDLLALERGYSETGKLRRFIEVDDVRRSVSFFGSTAGEGGWRIAIVDAVDELNVAGENALLKVLEEPPANALLLLVSHSPGSILATIRSRCRRLLLRALSESDVARAAATALARDPQESEIQDAARAGQGSVQAALTLLDGDALDLRKDVLGLLEKLPALDMRALHALSDGLGGSDQRNFASFVATINEWLTSQLKAGGPAARLAGLAEAWQKINHLASEAEEYNLDRKPVVFSVFGCLADAARA